MNKALINKYCRKFGFEVHGSGYIQAISKQSFKEDAFAKQKELVKRKSPMIFDIGANRGDVVAQYLELFPLATIHAFEPFPSSFKFLKDRYADNKSVHCHQFAIADSKKTMTFYVNENVDTNSLLKPRRTGLSSDKQVENKATIPVPCTSLDQFCTEHQISSIDILKMDIQGGEFLALKGAANLLENARISCIYSEAFFLEQYESQPLFHDISKLLHGYKFYLQDMYSPIYGKGNLAWCDVIFTLGRSS